MNYDEAVRWLSQIEKSGSVYGLKQMQGLTERLGHPERNVPIVHIAGTNGKGSTGAFLASILAGAGYRVGRYVSPVTRGYCEKIQYCEMKDKERNITWITEDNVAKYLTQIREVGVEQATAFEIETAMAFLACGDGSCDVLLLEAGLGGREDATNVIEHPICCALTSISLDHCALLGNTLELIAREKAGIAKKDVPLVYAKADASVEHVIRAECEKRGGISFAIADEAVEYSLGKLGLEGTCQRSNAMVAVQVALILSKNGFDITGEQIAQGLWEVQWPGRMEKLCDMPLTYLDGAHNPDAARELMRTLRIKKPNTKWIGIMGVFRDKDYRAILTIMKPILSKLYFITPNQTQRALTSKELMETASEMNLDIPFEDCGDISHALSKVMGREEPIVIFGSLSFQNQVYEYFK